MKNYFTIILLILSIGFGQNEAEVDTTWKNELIGALNFSQAYFDNWSAGGENTIAGQFDLSGKAINTTDKHSWATSGKIAYGTSKVGEDDAVKTIDEIKVESIYAILWKDKIDPYIALKGETQIAPGYTYSEDGKAQVSDFLDPAYFTQSAGLLYKPNDDISVRFGGAVKETITRDFPSPYADDPDTEEVEKTKIEPGAEAVFSLSKKLSETTQISSTLDLFNNFEGFDATDAKWDTDLIAQLTKYINVKFSLKVLYDKDISLKRQLSQALMLGVSYTIL